MTTKAYTIGYIFNRNGKNHFAKISDERLITKKFATIEECREVIKNRELKTEYRIMRGKEVIEVINK